jgi:hypothetical protein
MYYRDLRRWPGSPPPILRSWGDRDRRSILLNLGYTYYYLPAQWQNGTAPDGPVRLDNIMGRGYHNDHL